MNRKVKRFAIQSYLDGKWYYCNLPNYPFDDNPAILTFQSKEEAETYLHLHSNTLKLCRITTVYTVR